ncbi:MAG: GNAT family N-acetyltransferase [Bacteroidales bacterium]|jgi:ribosomal protein S18 acetylase RimI-like enzyme|nr:GNAT family N-acetyltransferase [Bacteroidales bacterium]MCI2122120.1 GNAT family N-acetyltransferase [Bacteroidales bacterium]MCI2145631.1 GNAT family N-acetyltransferase [Bacteroidales bacterium]
MDQTTAEMKVFDASCMPDSMEREKIIDFLFYNLEEYGDPRPDIADAMAYALGETSPLGGYVITACDGENLRGAVILNRTGMEGYIPGNILVYIATDKKYRGKGIGRKLMRKALELTGGSVALHVEPQNPAKFLYEKMGFTNKYLEMRHKKED